MWDCVLVFEIQGKYSPHRMEPLGIIGLLEQHAFSVESPTETVPSWQWVREEQSSPHRMDPPGIIGLLERHVTGEPVAGSVEWPTTETLPMWRWVILEGWINIKNGYFRKLCVCNVF